MKTPEDVRQEEIFKIIKDVVGDRIIRIKPIDLNINEHINADKNYVDLYVEVENLRGDGPTEFQLEARGYGYIDALVNAYIDKFEEEGFSTVRDFRFASFASTAQINGQSLLEPGQSSSSVVNTTLGILNSRHEVLYFNHESKSLVESGMNAVTNAFEYLLNSERAIHILHKTALHAKERHRGDIVEDTLNKLSYITTLSDYQELMNELNQKGKE